MATSPNQASGSAERTFSFLTQSAVSELQMSSPPMSPLSYQSTGRRSLEPVLPLPPLFVEPGKTSILPNLPNNAAIHQQQVPPLLQLMTSSSDTTSHRYSVSSSLDPYPMDDIQSGTITIDPKMYVPMQMSKTDPSSSSGAMTPPFVPKTKLLRLAENIMSAQDPCSASHCSSPSQEAVFLGVQALERQQAELEYKRAAAVLAAQQKHHLQEAMLMQMQQPQSLAPQPLTAGNTQHSNEINHKLTGTQQPPLHPGTTSHDSKKDCVPSTVHLRYVDNSDQNTDSTAETSGMGSAFPPSRLSASGNNGNYSKLMSRNGAFSRFLRTPLKSLSRTALGENDLAHSSNNPSATHHHINTAESTGIVFDMDEDGVWEPSEVKPLVYGYLHKLGRNGEWQRRWFETNGETLTYYKNKKRNKVLATLDLCKVGDITIDSTDPAGCTFHIQVAGRPYYLCAENKAKCKDWVISLNRVKEARMQIGGYTLVEPHFHHDQLPVNGNVDGIENDRSRTESGECAARVVMVANRQRTRGYGEGDMDENLKLFLHERDDKENIEVDESKNKAVSSDLPVDVAEGIMPSLPSAHADSSPALPPSSPTQSRPFGIVNVSLLIPVQESVVARWKKRRSNLEKWSMRLSRWARRMTLLRCSVKDDVVHMQRSNQIHYGNVNSEGQTSHQTIPGGLNHQSNTSDSQDEVYTGAVALRRRSFDNSNWGSAPQYDGVNRRRVMSDVDEQMSQSADDSIRSALSLNSSQQGSPAVRRQDDFNSGMLS